MTAVKSGLMIIDQHRADVRIRFDRYLHQLDEAPAHSQRLLFPETVELSPAEAVLLQSKLPSLEAVGFDLTQLGPSSYAVHGVPADLEGVSPSDVLHDLLSSPSSSNGLSEAHHQMALTLARRTSISYGEVLSNEEMDALINSLFACQNVNYTPNGKAILCILPQQDIEQLLG